MQLFTVKLLFINYGEQTEFMKSVKMQVFFSNKNCYTVYRYLPYVGNKKAKIKAGYPVSG